jgi:hypothetical protein
MGGFVEVLKCCRVLVHLSSMPRAGTILSASLTAPYFLT